jgi:hypothetical protein
MSDTDDEVDKTLQRLDEGGSVVEALPGLARVAASAWVHTAGWGFKTSTRAALRLGRAATSPTEARALAQDATKAASVVGELARSVSSGVPMSRALMNAGETLGGLVEGERPHVIDGRAVEQAPTSSPESLRDRGQALMRKSRDVWSADQGHPAYERILGELAPDEARILVMMLRNGPQPSVDVRTGGPVGMVSSQMVAAGLNMIGPRAGLRYLDRVPSYLNNLFRLGMVWFSREPLIDHLEYQVLEAQPEVLEAMHSIRFPKVVRRSIHLTPFGEDFCRTCLIPEGEAGVEQFPEHGAPSDADVSEAPSTS